MTGRRRWATIAGIALVLWIAGTIGIATLVVRSVADDDSDRSSPLTEAPISLSDRATTTLENRIIRPVLSGEGRVVADGQSFLLEANVTSADTAYRLLAPPVGVKALIAGGPAGFDCVWAGIAVSSQDPSTMAMRCRIPAEVNVVAGLTGTMVVTLTPPVEAPSLPLTAVFGQQGQGQVVVLRPDGTTEVRGVELGSSDTFAVEVKSGLQPGEPVLVAPVQSDLSAG